jgi:hypothetical protein
MKQFIYSPINPIWMNEVVTPNAGYNTLPFSYQSGRIPYSQKVKFAFPTKMQVLSDWVPTLKIYQCGTGTLKATISPSTPTTGIIGQTFTCYEFAINWSSYAADTYYIEITYTDDAPLLHTWRSGAIQSATNWPNTLVYEYTNSQNQYSIVWATGIVMSMVVEGAIADYEPGFEDVIYEDQYHNTTKLNSIPFRQFTLYAGSATGFAGMPTYMGDKLNWIFACDQIKIDGVYYQNTNGSKWETSRTDPYGTNFMGLKITIIEVNNLFLQSYQPGQIPVGAVKVVDRVIPFIGNSADITIPSIFTAASLLTKIIIYNYGGNAGVSINASTAADGSAPVCPPFVTTGQLKDVWEINEPFDAVSTLYLLGLAGTNCDIYVRYDQLDAPYILPPTAVKPFVKGTRYSYEEITPGDFTVDWNIGTGQGNPGTLYEGCVISGTNGTKDMNGLKEIGWNPSLPLTRDMLVGNTNNLVTLIKANLPNYDLNVDGAIRYKHGTAQNGGNPTQGLSSVNQNGEFNIMLGGSSQPIDISDRARVTLMFVCITN